MRKNTSLILSFLVLGIYISGTSVFAIRPPNDSPYDEVPDGGYFAEYFRNIVGDCDPNYYVTGFSSTPDTTYSTRNCASLDAYLKAYLGTNVRSQSNKYLAGFDGSGNADFLPNTWKSNGQYISNINTGNVGIGLEFAQAKLHVLSTATDGSEVARFEGIGAPYISLSKNNTRSSYWISSGPDTFLVNNGDGMLGFGSNNNQKQIVISKDGNIGIGTDNPQVKLEISSIMDNPLRLNKTSGTAWNYIEFIEGGTRKAWIGRTPNNTFAIGSDNATQDFYFDGFRNVGIGTSSPQAKLEVVGDSKMGDIYGGVDGGTRAIWKYNKTFPNYGIFYTEGTPDVLNFSPNGGGTTTPDMTLKGSNVGIGTSNPGTKLHVVKTGVGEAARFEATNDAFISLYNGPSNRIGFLSAAGGELTLRNDKNTPLNIGINNGTNIKINPSGIIDLLGNTKISGTVQITGGTPADGKYLRTDGAGNARWEFVPIPSEVDPEVLSSTNRAVPRWNGTALVDGVISDDGSNATTITQATSNYSTRIATTAFVKNQGYIISENDPKVGNISNGYVPVWSNIWGTFRNSPISIAGSTVNMNDLTVTSLRVSGAAAPGKVLTARNGNGDVEWRDPPTSGSGGGSGSGGAIISVFGRIGVISAQYGDYTASQISHGSTNVATEINDLYNLLNAKEPLIQSSFTNKYFRGDKTWQTLDTDAVSQGTTNLYFTDARAQSAITGGASTITTNNLTTNRTLISNNLGKVAVSLVSSTELGYLAGVTSGIQTQFGAKAPLASPILTGDPTAPTPLTEDNDNSIATTAFVKAQGYSTSSGSGGPEADPIWISQKANYATLLSPALTGTPTAPTATSETNTTQIATTAFVKAQEYLTKGTLASNYLSKWSALGYLINSSVFDNGSSVGIGTATPTSGKKLEVAGDTKITGSVQITGGSPQPNYVLTATDTLGNAVWKAASSSGGGGGGGGTSGFDYVRGIFCTTDDSTIAVLNPDDNSWSAPNVQCTPGNGSDGYQSLLGGTVPLALYEYGPDPFTQTNGSHLGSYGTPVAVKIIISNSDTDLMTKPLSFTFGPGLQFPFGQRSRVVYVDSGRWIDLNVYLDTDNKVKIDVNGDYTSGGGSNQFQGDYVVYYNTNYSSSYNDTSQSALIYGKHLYSECTSAGGTLVDLPTREKICQLPAIRINRTRPQNADFSCPAGWLVYNDSSSGNRPWVTTVATNFNPFNRGTACNGRPLGGLASCTTGSDSTFSAQDRTLNPPACTYEFNLDPGGGDPCGPETAEGFPNVATIGCY